MIDLEFTPELTAILKYVRECPHSLLVEALAGTGKTTALIEILKVLPQQTALVLAFNTRIADEMVRRKPQLPRNRLVHVKTLHAAGKWLVDTHFPRLKVDKSCSEELVSRSCEKGTSLRIRGAALKLLRLVKDFQHEQELDAGYAYNLGTEMGVFDKCEGPEIQRAIEVTQRAYQHSLNIAERDAIDFPDMGWLPLVLGLEPPHRYKALLLDEAQDVNPNQLAMVERLLAPGGRIIAAGDRYQAIYGWRGATPEETWEILRTKYKAKPLPLTVTWRCDRAIVKNANELVPSLRARQSAGEGDVFDANEEHLYETIEGLDGSVFVLSRTNAELLRVALELWKRQVLFNITQAPEVIYPLKDIVNKLCRNLRSSSEQLRMAEFRQATAAWRMTENMKAEGAGSSTWAERIEEQFNMLTYCAKYVKQPEDIMRLLDGIFAQDDSLTITLSTVHKAKGLEADHVFLLKETFARYRMRYDKVLGKERLPDMSEISQEELNVEYVAITRAKQTLTWVTK